MTTGCLFVLTTFENHFVKIHVKFAFLKIINSPVKHRVFCMSTASKCWILLRDNYVAVYNKFFTVQRDSRN